VTWNYRLTTAKITISIVASFTICGFLRIDLAHIPQEAYPFVVFVIGLENMFRLVNAVLAQPPELSTNHRVATALGDVGHLSLAAAAQNIVCLWLLSKVVSPGVQAFCAFAAVALVFDFVFHLTFFIAVLSVDVRRMELQESIDRAKARESQDGRVNRLFWWDMLLQGNVPFSTRIAGSAVSVTFILALNVHFSDIDNLARRFYLAFASLMGRKPTLNKELFPTFAPPPINQARTPQAWLRIQDYQSAREVINFVNANRTHLVARVYEPLIVLRKGSDRIGVPLKFNTLRILWDMLDRHSYPFVLVLIFTMASIALLMQYLLWNELPEDGSTEMETKQYHIKTETMPKVHKLDIFSIVASSKGQSAAVALDRTMSTSAFDPVTRTFSVQTLSAISIASIFWPVKSISIHENGKWLALCNGSGDIILWNIQEQKFCHALRLDSRDQRPILFALASVDSGGMEVPTLVVVLSDARLFEIDVEKSEIVQSFQICSSPVSYATMCRVRDSLCIVALSRIGGVHEIFLQGASKTITPLYDIDPRLSLNAKDDRVRHITIYPALGVYLAVRSHGLDLIDISTRILIYSIDISTAQPHSMRMLHSIVRECRTCMSSAVHSLSFAFSGAENHTCVIRTYAALDDHGSLICLRPTTNSDVRTCKGLEAAEVTIHNMENSGVWEATGVQTVVGIRHYQSSGTPSSTTSGADVGLSAGDLKQRLLSTKSRSRHGAPLIRSNSGGKNDIPSSFLRIPHSNTTTALDNEEWEVWSLSCSGETHTAKLASASDLLVDTPGPMVKFGKRSVAVAVGNVVQVATVGGDHFEEEVDDRHRFNVIGNAARRRKLVVARKEI
jgi:WD40 repeat protein